VGKKNRTIVSLGAFGRISLLNGQREEIYEFMDYDCHDRYWPRLDEGNTQSLEEKFHRVMPLLLKELNGIIEAIILSDELLFFNSYSDDYVKKIKTEHNFYHPPFLAGSLYSFVCADEANRLCEIVLNGMNVTDTSSNNTAIFDIELLIDLLKRHTFIPCYLYDTLSADNLDYGMLKALTLEPESLWGEPEKTDFALRKVSTFLSNRLGKDWEYFKNHIDLTYKWPEELLYKPSIPRELHRIGFALSLFAELDLAIDRGNLGVSNLSLGNYYQVYGSQKQVINANLKKIITRRYDKVLNKKLEEFGFVSMNTLMPPLFRLCLDGSKSIADIIRNAIKYHNHKWFIDLRKYIFELSSIDSPEKLIKYLNKFDDYLNNSFIDSDQLSNFGFGFSLTGSVSISVSKIAEKLLKWKNRSLIIHSKVSDIIFSSDSLNQLSTILEIPQLELSAILKKADF